VTVFLTSFMVLTRGQCDMAEIVVFLGMGGTIAGTATAVDDNVGYKAGQLGVEQLLQSVPALGKMLGEHLPVAEQVCQIDSKDLVHGDWVALTKRLLHYLALADVRAVIVTHGTDTLEETAYWLARVLPRALLSKKPVVLTCAMRPASSTAPDGPGNLADACAVACSAGVRGVLVVCAGKILDGEHVQKVHPYRVDAFDAGEIGALGAVEEGRVRLFSDWPSLEKAEASIDRIPVLDQSFPRVEILLSHAGVSGATVRSMLNLAEGDDPVRGIVVAGTGNGTVHKDLESALQVARERGIRIVRVSRCAYGRVVEAPDQSKESFAVYGLSAVKARIALMLDIAGHN
jgi:L-asparaginase